MFNTLSNNENDNLTSEDKDLTETVNTKNEVENITLTNGTKEIDTESEERDTTILVADKKDEWIDLLGSGAIMKKIIIEGKPNTRPQRSQKCIINYTCSLHKDNTVVDSAENFDLHLGESDVR